MNRFILCVAMASLGIPCQADAATFVWTGGGDGISLFQENNWQLQGGGAVPGNPLAPSVTITDHLIFTGVAPNVSSELRLGASLQIDGGTLVMTTGGGMQGGSISIINAGSFSSDWANSTAISLTHGTLTLRGAGNPLSSSTIACTGTQWSLIFTNEPPANVQSEHLAKITIDGQPAVIGANVLIAATGSGSTLSPQTLPADSDNDGLPDNWEITHFNNLTQTATGDPDGDLLDNAGEFQRKTDPNKSDTDGDGLTDKVETGTGIWVGASDIGTDPLSADTDRDGLPDGVETRTGSFVNGTDTGTDPHLANTDGDRITDGAEVARNSNPTDPASAPDLPNVVFILADDLGYNHLSCYGQTRLSTPHLDALASTGMRFTNAYAGCTVCGPSRSSLLTGLHSGHIPFKPNGGHVDITGRTGTLGERFKEAGFVTGAFGKWGIGGLGSGQTPNDRGFDEFHGMLDQGHGHRHYPSYLIRNNQRVPTGNTVASGGNTSSNSAHRVLHSHDAFSNSALQFIDDNHDSAFFCYLALTLPHTEIIANPTAAAEFANPPAWGTEGVHYNQYTADTESHIAQSKPHTHFAGMLRMIDNSVGAIVAKLAEHGLTENTLIVFTSDNGGQLQAVWGSAPSIFFNANGILRGGKQDSYEGGLRVPFIAKWPGKIPAGSVSDLPFYFADILPTSCEILGLRPPEHTDGLSILPTLTGNSAAQKKHSYLFWTHNFGQIDHAVRAGKWKAVKRGGNAIELYDLEADPSETINRASANPAIVQEMQRIITLEYRTDIPGPSPSVSSPVYPNHPE
jgi:arylsulfatase A-like enzyme